MTTKPPNLTWTPTTEEWLAHSTPIIEDLEKAKMRDKARTADSPIKPTIKRNSAAEKKCHANKVLYAEPKQRIEALTDILHGALDDRDRGFVYLSEGDAEFLLAGFEAFLFGKAKSLDAAFGLAKGRGAPKRGPDPKNERIVRRVMNRKDKTLEELEEETGLSARHLQRLVERHGKSVSDADNKNMAEKLSEAYIQIKKKNKHKQ